MNPAEFVTAVNVAFDGEPLSESDSRALAGVRIQKRLSLPSQCELTFVDPEGPLAQGKAVRPGVQLRVWIAGQSPSLFEGDVTALQHVYDPAHGHQVRVRGYDRLHRLRKRQHVQSWPQSSLHEVARQLLEADGLTVAGSGSEIKWAYQIQGGPTDFEWLAALARREGLHFYLDGTELRFLTLVGEDEPIRLTLGHELIEANLEINGAETCSQISCQGWDALHPDFCQGQAQTPRLGREVSAHVDPSDVGADDERWLLDRGVTEEGQAAVVAQAELDRRAAESVVFWGIATGDSRLRPGVRVDVAGIASALAGTFVLASVTHTFDRQSGFLSDLDSRLLPFPQPTVSQVLVPGVVIDVADPDEQGRIRVQLPTYCKVETDWMRVLCPAAGPDKGLVALPAPGDLVLVALAHGDLAQGIVLGGLYDKAGPPDAGVVDNAIRRYTFTTPQGQRLVLDDQKQTVRLQNQDGSYLLMTPDKVVLHAERDLDIAAPGRAIVIRGRTIDLEKA